MKLSPRFGDALDGSEQKSVTGNTYEQSDGGGQEGAREIVLRADQIAGKDGRRNGSDLVRKVHDAADLTDAIVRREQSGKGPGNRSGGSEAADG